MKLQKNNRIRARAAKTRFSRAAFTLMEVLLAIAMISMLAFIVVVNLDKTMSESQTKITESFVNGSLQTPLMTFKLAVGRYPTTEEGLKALLEAPEAFPIDGRARTSATFPPTRGEIRTSTAARQ